MKYRGADGWINDDGVTRRYKSKDDTKPKEKASKPEASNPDKPPRPRLTSCPNCPFSVRWRKVEGYCDNCGWGKEQSDWDNYKPTALQSGDGALACCGMFFGCVAVALVLMGIGYGIGGGAGLLAGFGLSLAVPAALFFMMHSATSNKKETDK